MIKTIIFDVDGVVIESADIKTKAFALMFRDEFPELVDQFVAYHLEHMGVSRYEKFKHFYRNILKQPLSPAREAELGERFSEIVFNEVIKAPLVKGVQQFLDANHKKYNCFVVSGTPEDELVKVLQKRKLAGYFKEIHGSPPLKTEITKTILKRFNYNPREVVFVGDADTDRRAAHAAQVWFVARVVDGSQALGDCEYQIKDFTDFDGYLNSNFK